MANNRNGDVASLQISVIGQITNISTKDFTQGSPFNVKNDSEDSIALEVNLWGMEEDEFVSTNFEPGWNPEIVRSIRSNTNAANFDLKWGY